ncbi:hypothetical protein AGMMS49593_09360 [Endomicrobiia bacterium]|nr:hypothetical protein AGMMS49593_09360 [Endomicrobiia bacterium]
MLWGVGCEFLFPNGSGAVTLDLTYSHYTSSSILRSESWRWQSFGKLVYEKLNKSLKINCGIVGVTMGLKFKI